MPGSWVLWELGNIVGRGRKESFKRQPRFGDGVCRATNILPNAVGKNLDERIRRDRLDDGHNSGSLLKTISSK